MKISFFVPGHPQTQGSLTSFKHHSTGKIITPQNKKVITWRGIVSIYAAQAMSGQKIITGPVYIDTIFYFLRPKCHYRTGKNAHILKDNAPAFPIKQSTGDGDKLTRAIWDALTGVVFSDDSQVVEWSGSKFYDTKEGVQITAETI